MPLALYRRYARKRRFWTRVEVAGPADCWPWRGSGDGGPMFDGRPACEYAYELARGPLPSGARIEQRCGNLACMNPDHLVLRDHD
jgi:hypothetical protein